MAAKVFWRRVDSSVDDKVSEKDGVSTFGVEVAMLGSGVFCTGLKEGKAEGMGQSVWQHQPKMQTLCFFGTLASRRQNGEQQNFILNKHTITILRIHTDPRQLSSAFTLFILYLNNFTPIASKSEGFARDSLRRLFPVEN
jgi:hypothetical protein